jgi:MtN3 and saliva related transmembrane protein
MSSRLPDPFGRCFANWYMRCVFMSVGVEFIGSTAAACTTLCWIPQALKIIREKRTEGISLVTQCVFTFGVALWAAYGFLVQRWPVIIANIVTFFFSAAVLLLKVRYSSGAAAQKPD